LNSVPSFGDCDVKSKVEDVSSLVEEVIIIPSSSANFGDILSWVIVGSVTEGVGVIRFSFEKLGDILS
jgi:hypothetical protein